MSPVLLTGSVTLTALICAGAVWVWVMLPKWANLHDDFGIGFWYVLGWIIPFGAGAVPIVLLWTHL